MAWEKCQWCGQNLNGYSARNRHYNQVHPQEYALHEAQREVQRWESNIRQAQERLNNYRILTAFFERELPDLIRSILEGESTRQLQRWTRKEGVSDDEYLAGEVQRYQAILVKAQATLAALEVTK